MNCTDQRILNVCRELLHFLKSDKDTEIIHGKELKKLARGKAIQTEIVLGFVTLRAVYVPMTIDANNKTSGSDEGCSIFIYLPFADSESINAEKLEIKCYYSERGSNARLTATVPDLFKSSQIGPKRIVTTLKVSTSDPLA
jgi:hypothetical protein